MIYQRTEGNPLFVVNLVQDFVRQGMIEENNGHWRVSANAETTVASVPASVRRMVEHQLSKLPAADLRVFEAASLIGREFTVEALAAALDTEITTLDERCEAFARRGQFLHPTGVEESTEGTISSRYGFLHSLFQEVLHEQVGAGRRVRLHKSIGEWKEFRYQRHRSEMAAELAAHFDEDETMVVQSTISSSQRRMPCAVAPTAKLYVISLERFICYLAFRTLPSGHSRSCVFRLLWGLP